MGVLFIPQMIYEYGKPRWNDADRVKPKNSEKISSNATIPTWIDPASNPSLRVERPATKCLSLGTAWIKVTLIVVFPNVLRVPPIFILF
jgi:hypothetical protein